MLANSTRVTQIVMVFVIILIASFGSPTAFAEPTASTASKDESKPDATQAADAGDTSNSGTVSAPPVSASKRKKKKKVTLVTPAPDLKNPDVDSCGPGWAVIQKRTLSATTTRQTINLGGILPTFGMTSGTMGCAQMPLSTLEEAAVKYTYTNKDSLMMEMAEGQGEILTAYAQTLGCSDGAIDAFSKMTQRNYRQITRDGEATGIELFQNVRAQMKNDPLLVAGCPSA